MANRIQSLLDVEYRVVQAPMTYIARAELAAAVSEAGGLGMIETLTAEGRADLMRVRELTNRPVAANLMIQGWKRDPSIVDVLANGADRRQDLRRAHLTVVSGPGQATSDKIAHDT